LPFRTRANIDPNQHKGLVISNSVTNNSLIVTGLSLTNAQPMHVALVDANGSHITSIGTIGGTPTETVISVTTASSDVLSANTNRSYLEL